MIFSAKQIKQMIIFSKENSYFTNYSVTIYDLKFPWQFNVIMSSQILSCVSQYEINFESFGDYLTSSLIIYVMGDMAVQ
jgi:hypothetical protein